jgi:hypothetical protein
MLLLRQIGLQQRSSKNQEHRRAGSGPNRKGSGRPGLRPSLPPPTPPVPGPAVAAPQKGPIGAVLPSFLSREFLRGMSLIFYFYFLGWGARQQRERRHEPLCVCVRRAAAAGGWRGGVQAGWHGA